AAGHFTRNDLPLMGRCPERHESARRHLIARCSQRIGRHHIAPGQRDVATWNVVEIRSALEPSEIVVVGAYDSGIRGCALTEIDPAIGPGHRAVRVMVAQTRQPIDQHRYRPASRVDAQDAPAVEVIAIRDEEAAVQVIDTVPWTTAFTFGNHHGAGCIQPKQAWREYHLAVGIARLDDVRASVCIEGDARGKREPRGYDFDLLSTGDGDVTRLQRARRVETRHPAAR